MRRRKEIEKAVPPVVDFDQFEIGQTVEYNFTNLTNNSDDPRNNTWHVGVVEEIDRNDPNLPWYVALSEEHHKSESTSAEWFRAEHVRARQYVIDEEDELV